METDHNRVLDMAFAAVENNDLDTIRSIYADDIKIWHAHDGLVKNRDDNIATLGKLHALGTLKYHFLERIHAGSRVVQRHKLTITTKEGKEFYLNTAIFLTITDNKIAAFDEYMDSKEVGAVGLALMAQAETKIAEVS